jgi:hypothetical protein
VTAVELPSRGFAANYTYLKIRDRLSYKMNRMNAILGTSDACIAVHPSEAVDRGAAAAWIAFVAWRRDVVEVSAARALQEIAADRGHVAQLLRGAGKQRARQHRIALLDQRVISEIGIGHERADAEPAGCSWLDLVQGKLRDIDQLRWPLDIHLHQVHQIGSAGDEFRAGACAHLAHSVRHIAGAGIMKADHDCPIACWIAATIFE